MIKNIKNKVASTTIRINARTREKLDNLSKQMFNIPFEHVSKDFLINKILEKIKLK